MTSCQIPQIPQKTLSDLSLAFINNDWDEVHGILECSPLVGKNNDKTEKQFFSTELLCSLQNKINNCPEKHISNIVNAIIRNLLKHTQHFFPWCILLNEKTLPHLVIPNIKTEYLPLLLHPANLSWLIETKKNTLAKHFFDTYKDHLPRNDTYTVLSALAAINQYNLEKTEKYNGSLFGARQSAQTISVMNALNEILRNDNDDTQKSEAILNRLTQCRLLTEDAEIGSHLRSTLRQYFEPLLKSWAFSPKTTETTETTETPKTTSLEHNQHGQNAEL